MFAVELAAAAAPWKRGLRADMAAGFSLGEIGALTYTRAVDLETGFHLVCRRGTDAGGAEEQPTAMAAVLKLSNEEVGRSAPNLRRSIRSTTTVPDRSPWPAPRSSWPPSPPR
ncbi:MAG: hypothetical protein ACLSF6_01845 [Evtepia gabavorous]